MGGSFAPPIAYPWWDGSNWQMKAASKPLVRPDGSALAVGDQYYDTGDREWYFWNGTYWLTERLYRFDLLLFTSISTNIFPGSLIASERDFWLESIAASATFAAGTYDASNCWQFRVVRAATGTSGGVADFVLNSLQNSIALSEFRTYQAAINLHRDVSALSQAAVRLDVWRVGSPPNLTVVGSSLFFRYAKP